MNHFGTEPESSTPERSLDRSFEAENEVSRSDDHSSSPPNAPNTRSQRTSSAGFFFFMGAFMIYMLVQAIFFPTGTAPT